MKITMRKNILYYLCFLFLSISSITYAQETKHLNLADGVIAKGYDVVSYFDGKALKGKKSIASTSNGITYYFANKENKVAFKANPLNYPITYGGWCAYAMGAKGKKVAINPENFKIIDGKLYLFYNSRKWNTLEWWNKDEDNLKQKADDNWRRLANR